MYRGPGVHDAFSVLSTLISVLFFLLCLVVAVGVIFLLVRFLLVATRAAQLYVEKNGPAKPVTPAASPAPASPAAPAAPAEAPPTSVAAPVPPSAPTGPAAPVTKTVTKPAPKRTPKSPPA